MAVGDSLRRPAILQDQADGVGQALVSLILIQLADLAAFIVARYTSFNDSSSGAAVATG
jgi:hypothetical protein